MGIFFTALAASICALIFIPEQINGQIWQQINLGDVCFKTHGKRPGVFHYLGKEGKLVAAMKLVHRRGYVRCEANTAYDSHWGCYHHKSFMNHPLNVIITDQNDNIVYPAEKYIRNGGLWYYLPFTDSKSSELVFANYDNPLYVTRGSMIKIWYGEDLRDWKTSGNGGEVCVDVFAHLQ